MLGADSGIRVDTGALLTAALVRRCVYAVVLFATVTGKSGAENSLMKKRRLEDIGVGGNGLLGWAKLSNFRPKWAAGLQKYFMRIGRAAETRH
jgi:hypothetical protein